MTPRQDQPATVYFADEDALLVTDMSAEKRTELFLAVHADGTVTAFNGHVDLGTGIRTALAQIVAEELCVPFESVRMVLGTTSVAPIKAPPSPAKRCRFPRSRSARRQRPRALICCRKRPTASGSRKIGWSSRMVLFAARRRRWRTTMEQRVRSVRGPDRRTNDPAHHGSRRAAEAS